MVRKTTLDGRRRLAGADRLRPLGGFKCGVDFRRAIGELMTGVGRILVLTEEAREGKNGIEFRQRTFRAYVKSCGSLEFGTRETREWLERYDVQTQIVHDSGLFLLFARRVKSKQTMIEGLLNARFGDPTSS